MSMTMSLHPGITLEAVIPSRVDHRALSLKLGLNASQISANRAVSDMLSLLGREPLWAGEIMEKYIADSTINDEGCRRPTGTPGTPGTKANESSVTRAMLGIVDLESPGEIGSQVNQRVAVYQRKPGARWRTKLIIPTGLSVGSELSVWKWHGASNAWGFPRSVLALRSSGTLFGIVTKIIDASTTSPLVEFEEV